MTGFHDGRLSVMFLLIYLAPWCRCSCADTSYSINLDEVPPISPAITVGMVLSCCSDEKVFQAGVAREESVHNTADREAESLVFLHPAGVHIYCGITSRGEQNK